MIDVPETLHSHRERGRLQAEADSQPDDGNEPWGHDVGECGHRVPGGPVFYVGPCKDCDAGAVISDWPLVETLSVNPCLRSVSAGAVAVGLVGCLVVEDALGQAVPEDLQPAVAQGTQGGVVAVSRGDFLLAVLEPLA